MAADAEIMLSTPRSAASAITAPDKAEARSGLSEVGWFTFNSNGSLSVILDLGNEQIDG